MAEAKGGYWVLKDKQNGAYLGPDGWRPDGWQWGKRNDAKRFASRDEARVKRRDFYASVRVVHVRPKRRPPIEITSSDAEAIAKAFSAWKPTRKEIAKAVAAAADAAAPKAPDAVRVGQVWEESNDGGATWVRVTIDRINTSGQAIFTGEGAGTLPWAWVDWMLAGKEGKWRYRLISEASPPSRPLAATADHLAARIQTPEGQESLRKAGEATRAQLDVATKAPAVPTSPLQKAVAEWAAIPSDARAHFIALCLYGCGPIAAKAREVLEAAAQ